MQDESGLPETERRIAESDGRDPTVDSALIELIRSSWSLPPDRLPERVKVAALRLGANDAVLMLIDLQQQWLMAFEPGSDRALERQSVDDTPAGEAFRSRRSVRESLGLGARWWFPVLDSADRLGVLGVVTDDGAAIDTAGFQALASLTGELLAAKTPYGDSIALARRTRDTTLAAELRWAMLPPLTFASPEVTIAGILEPAYEIAGDTFDYALNGSVAHVAILDAMGHGLEASRMANLAVTSYRHSRRAGHSLHRTVAEMDQVISDQYGSGKFVTGQLATLDLVEGIFRMLNLGHPLPLLLRDSEVVGELACEPTVPAGLGSDPGVLTETQLEPGDFVLLYTDGITDARDSTGERYGPQRFADFVSSLLVAGEPPEELLRRVIRDVLSYQDFQAADDSTLLAVGWRTPAGRIP